MTTQDYDRLRDAVRRYASHAPLDLKTPAELQRDLFAISGEPHVHRDRIGDDSCLLCGRDLRDEVHIPFKSAADGPLRFRPPVMRAADVLPEPRARRAPKCDECGIYPADPPSKLCPGCEAYREHTGAM